MTESATITLGPIQKEWIRRLRAHPERQQESALGTQKPDGTYTACCLGEGGLVAGVCHWGGHSKLCVPDPTAEGEDQEGFLGYGAYQALGLWNSRGGFHSPVVTPTESYTSLANMNDGGLTWPQIADYMEANPDNVFERSV